MKLSVKKVERASKPGRYGDGAGLYLQITKAGSRSWVLRFERNGKETMLGLGSCRDFTLAEARERARDMRRKLADGINPRQERLRAASLSNARQMTFAAAAQQYFELHETQWRNQVHRQQFMQSLRTHAFPVLGVMPVSAVDTAAVLAVLEPIWLVKPTTAARVRARIEAVLSWCAVRNLRPTENPARWGGHLKAALPSKNKVARVQHHPAMAIDDVPSFMAELSACPGVAAKALQFLVLTAARTGEVVGARWSEVDLAHKTWTIPADRMKGNREHRVPLPTAAVELLRSLPREQGNPFVFIGGRHGRPIGDQAMIGVLKAIRQNITVHGFRSSFRDWAATRTAFPHDVCEAALAHHSAKSAVVQAYQRSDLLERRVALMSDWAGFCACPVQGAGVIPLQLRA
jgi:integrase